MESCPSSVGKWVSALYRYSQSYIDRELKDYNIGGGQYIFLARLYEQDGLSQEELAEFLSIDKGTTARALTKLEREGYIVREKNPNDIRAYKIYITEKGHNIKPFVMETLLEWNQIIAKGLGQEEVEIVLKLLKTMSKNAASYLKKS